jgi:DNA polymerase-3 subunit epsilon
MRPIGWVERLLGRRPSDPRPWRETVYWALDLETTGLQPGRDEVLSVGLVPVRDGTIRYGERFSRLVRPARLGELPQDGLGAHHILPGELEDAPPLAAVLEDVDRRVREGALLLHHAPLDLSFLTRAYAAAGRQWPGPRVVDTVLLLLRLHRRRSRFEPHPTPPVTALAEARAALGLPPHRAHDALADALATAELFLALVARLDIASGGELY